MTTIAWFDGRLVDPEGAHLSLLDHGFVVGDGVFETCELLDGEPFALTRHLARLNTSAVGLGIDPPQDAVVRDEAGRPVLASASGSDRTTALNLGVDYAINRLWLVGCQLGWEKRRVSDDGSQVSFPFEARTATCLAQLTLQ